ncbi:MAG: GxxExxY protein [Opitutaceae bacterium]|nr:GxxExxY protein [Opitutaceae bacterium]|tara:strand:- start:2194 stop:2571 length:378 start_codon:yes stop_codon:yes gene_type:complete
MTKPMLEKETYAILGACFEVYKEKGWGFLEAIYQECLEVEFELQNIPARSLVKLPLTYKGRELKKGYEADFICFDSVLVGLKAVLKLTDEYRAQIQNYLHATGFRVGLLINLGHYPKVEHERFAV